MQLLYHFRALEAAVSNWIYMWWIPPRKLPGGQQIISAICYFFSLIQCINSPCEERSTFRFSFLCLSDFWWTF